MKLNVNWTVGLIFTVLTILSICIFTKFVKWINGTAKEQIAQQQKLKDVYEQSLKASIESEKWYADLLDEQRNSPIRAVTPIERDILELYLGYTSEKESFSIFRQRGFRIESVSTTDTTCKYYQCRQSVTVGGYTWDSFIISFYKGIFNGIRFSKKCNIPEYKNIKDWVKDKYWHDVDEEFEYSGYITDGTTYIQISRKNGEARFLLGDVKMKMFEYSK